MSRRVEEGHEQHLKLRKEPTIIPHHVSHFLLSLQSPPASQTSSVSSLPGRRQLMVQHLFLPRSHSLMTSSTLSASIRSFCFCSSRSCRCSSCQLLPVMVWSSPSERSQHAALHESRPASETLRHHLLFPYGFLYPLSPADPLLHLLPSPPSPPPHPPSSDLRWLSRIPCRECSMLLVAVQARTLPRAPLRLWRV